MQKDKATVVGSGYNCMAQVSVCAKLVLLFGSVEKDQPWAKSEMRIFIDNWHSLVYYCINTLIQGGSIMKKLLCIVTVIGIIVSLSGCSLLGYTSMDAKDLVKLSDDELIVALLMRLGIEEFDTLNESQKVVYTAVALEVEILDGGTVQFLSNERLDAAPYVCEALEKIGAKEHLVQLKQALAKNNVNLNDLSDFDTEDSLAFSRLYDHYNFDKFDCAYETLPSMPALIRNYIQAHIEDF